MTQTAYDTTCSYHKASLLGITNLRQRVAEKHENLPRSITESQKYLMFKTIQNQNDEMRLYLHRY